MANEVQPRVLSQGMARDALMEAFLSRERVLLVDQSGHPVVLGVIQSLAHEDGSGFSFNVMVQEPALVPAREYHLRTVERGSW